MQAQVGFGRVYFPGPNRVGARAHFMRWAQPILRLSRRACARANDGLACVNAGQPLMKNLSHFVKSVLYIVMQARLPQKPTILDSMIKVTALLHCNWSGNAMSGGRVPHSIDCLLNAGPTASTRGPMLC